MKTISIKSFFLFVSLFILMSCGKAEQENVLVVSVEPQKALLKEIVGDRFEVVAMLPPGANPEVFEPGMQTRQQLETAKAFMTTGYLPFETKLAEANGGRVKVVNTSKGIQPVYGTHGHAHEGHSHVGGDGADPHIWTSVKNAKIIAKNMYESVIELDPEGKEYYTPRYEKLITRLDSLDNAFDKRLSAEGITKSFAIWHPSLSYFARDYDLEQIAVGYENKEVSVSTQSKVIDEVKEEGVKVFFFQKTYDSTQATTLNDAMGTTLVPINPLDYDWERQLEGIVSALCQ